MKLLVIADTHGYLHAATRAILERGPWDHVLHLGDSVLDAVDLAASLGRDLTAVRGNNEFPGAENHADVLVFELAGVRFYAIHGHELDLNHYNDGFDQALATLVDRARQSRAEVALFGHTHVPYLDRVGGVLIVNPGGIGLGDQKKTYAEITVRGPGQVDAIIKEI